MKCGKARTLILKIVVINGVGGRFCPARDIWQNLETFLVVTMDGVGGSWCC